MPYAARPDGLFDVTLDDGTTLPMALSEEQLRAAGHEPVTGGLPADALAANDFQNPYLAKQETAQDFQDPYLPGAPTYASPEDAGRRSRGDIEPIDASAPIKPPSPNGRGAFVAGIPTEKQQINPGEYLKTHTLTGKRVEAKPTFNVAGGQTQPAYRDVPHEATSANSSGERTATSNLVSMPGAAGAAAQGAPVSARTGGGGVGGGGVKPYRLPDDIRDDLTGDTRPENLEASSQGIAALREQEQMDREKLLLDQQAQLDQQRAQRAEINRRIRAKEELISTREREAEALRPQSAREIWQDRGSFAQAMGAVTMMLGGWLQGFQNRATNPGVDLLNDSIRQEIADQRARYEDAKEKGREARNDYSRAIEIYGTPEAAEQDMLIRRYAIAENLVKNRAAAVGTAEYLQAANQAVEGLRQQRGQAKLQLFELERARTLQAANAAAAAAQAQEYARNGIVKIGSQYYTVDPSTKQFVPLDKAAQLAGRGITSEAGRALAGTAESLGAMRDQLTQYAKRGGKPWTPEGSNVAARGLRSATDAVGGQGTYKDLALDDTERDRSDKFLTMRQAMVSMGTQLTGAGAPSEGEALRSAAGNAQTEEQLINVINTYDPIIRAKLGAYRGGGSAQEERE